MANTRSVKRALASLATGDPFPEWHRAHVIQNATDAIDDLNDSLRFLNEYGLPALRQASAAAERNDERTLARRGQRALAAFEWYSRACAPSACTNQNNTGRNTWNSAQIGESDLAQSTADRDTCAAQSTAGQDADSPVERDHFHHGHGTPLGGRSEREGT